MARGFSLVELVIVMAIFLLLLAVADVSYSNFSTATKLDIATKSVVKALHSAQMRAGQVNGDARWGVEVLTTEIVVFKGTSYATRDQSADQSLNMPGGVVPSGLIEVVFAPVMGYPAAAGTITLTNSSGSKNIAINEKGTLSY